MSEIPRFPWGGSALDERPSVRVKSITYGRGPSEHAMADCREMTLVHERMLQFGRLHIGMTVYRVLGPTGASWRVLPDPEKPDPEPLCNLEPGGVNWRSP